MQTNNAVQNTQKTDGLSRNYELPSHNSAIVFVIAYLLDKVSVLNFVNAVRFRNAGI